MLYVGCLPGSIYSWLPYVDVPPRTKLTRCLSSDVDLEVNEIREQARYLYGSNPRSQVVVPRETLSGSIRNSIATSSLVPRADVHENS